MNCRLASLLLVACAGSAVAASGSDPAPSWPAVQKAVSDGRWKDAAQSCAALIHAKPRDIQAEQCSALLPDLWLQVGDRKQAASMAERYLALYSSGADRDRVRTVAAIVLAGSGDFYSAGEALLQVLSTTRNPVAYARARETLVKLLSSSTFSSDELQALLEHYPVDDLVMGWVHYQLGRELQTEGRFRAARHFYRKVLDLGIGDAKLAEAAQAGLTELKGRGAGIPTLVLVAPLSGDFAEFGSSLVQGALLAIEGVPGASNKIRVRVIDDHADAATAVAKVREAIEQDSVIGVIGPVMSNPSAALAAWMSVAAPAIPMVTPTATDDGIASLGRNIFQLNVPTASLARAVADHAVLCLGLHEFGIVAPNSEYGRQMSAEFADEIIRLGGSIEASEFYTEGKQDYKALFDRLRARKFDVDNRRRQFSAGATDAAAATGRIRDSWLSDSVMTFPGLFLPASEPADAAKMAGQALFFKVEGRYLGANGWYGRDLLVEGRRQVEGSYLATSFTETEEDSSFQVFKRLYFGRWKQQPGRDKVAGLSYDATRIVLQAWTQGGNTLDRIAGLKGFQGTYGTMEIDPVTGANRSARVLTVAKGRFETVQGCASP